MGDANAAEMTLEQWRDDATKQRERANKAEYRLANGPQVVEAHQWFKNGDHPEDNCETFIHSETGEPFQGEGKVVRYYRTPDLDGQNVCERCGRTMHYHGWIDVSKDGHIVCPGDIILTIGKDKWVPCKLSTEKALSASEALFGFCAWLTGREKRVSFSAHDNAGVAADLITEFCRTNDLKEPRPNWTKRLTHPKEADAQN